MSKNRLLIIIILITFFYATKINKIVVFQGDVQKQINVVVPKIRSLGK